MAFVFRGERSCERIQKTPGPGEYEGKGSKSEKAVMSAPFNSGVKRKLWSKNTNPGPGAYASLDRKYQNQLLVEDPSQNIAMFETPKHTGSFISGSNRFIKTVSNGPGPGHYECLLSTGNKRVNVRPLSHKLKDFVKQLYEQSKHTAGEMWLETGEQESKVVKTQKAAPTNAVFASKVKREVMSRPTTSVGPGSYYLESVQLRPSYKTASHHYEETMVVRIEEEEKQIGPGSYYNEELHTAFKKPVERKEDFFGSKVSRFECAQEKYTPGPASYNLNDCQLKKGIKIAPQVKRQVIEVMRNQSIAHCKANDISVGNTFETQLKESKKCRKINYFGLSQERFKNKNHQIVQIEKIHLLNDEKEQKQNIKKQIKIFRKKQKHQIKYFSDPKISLNVIFGNKRLSQMQINKMSKETEVVMKQQIKAPFLSYTPRFKQNIEEKDFINDLITKSQINIKRFPQKKPIYYKKKLRPQTCVKKQQQDLRSYDPILPKKKSFNKLFL